MKDSKIKHWKVTLKEKRGSILTPELIGPYSYKDVIEFFGLKNDDVEWYKIEEE